MIEPTPIQPEPRPGSPAAARERQRDRPARLDRREVARRLAAAGWQPRRRYAARSTAGGGGSAAGSAAAAEAHERFATALRRALEAVDLPVFAAFGRYLGTRPDLTGIAGAEVLAAIPDRSSPAAAADVAELLAAELGGVPGELFAGFETEPYAARLLVESHHAWSPDGRVLAVHLAWPSQPDLAAALAAEIGLLPLLAPGLPPARFPLDEAIADFRAAIAGELDFRGAAEALEAIAAAAGPIAAGGPHGPLAVPAVERELTSARVLTVESPAGGSWEELAADPGRRAVAYGFARRLSLGWLELALSGSRLPVAASPRARADGRIALDDGVFVAADGAAQANLTAYVRAAARDDAEGVAACLLREVVPATAHRRRDAGGDDLGKRLRQAVPFRDSDLSGGSVAWGADGLAGQLLTHWQLIHRSGYRPRPYLRELYRGLLWLSRAGGLVAPGRDPLRDALEDFDWRSARAGLYRGAEPERAMETLESYLVTLASLPQQLDRALARLAGGSGSGVAMASPPPSAAGNAGHPGDPADHRRRDASAAAAALGMSMAALAILVEKLLGAGAPAWVGETGAVVFLILGALLLRAAGARR